MSIDCITLSTPITPACDTVFDCATSEDSFSFNAGDPVDEIECGSSVPVSFLWVGCDGQRAPDATGGGVGLSVSVGSAVFSSSNGLTNNYVYTLPNVEGPHSATFTWGNSNDPELCSRTINFNCVAPDLLHEGGVAPLSGFGTNSVFGSAGQTITVTNLNDSGAGSFREAVDTAGPRTIEFDVSGIIAVSTPIVVSDPFVTIAGSTAPGPIGVQATSTNNTFAFRTVTTDILVENFGIYQNNDSTGNVNNRDALNISTGSYRVCFSQCTMMWGADETVSVFHSANNLGDITIQYCIIAEGLDDVGHASGPHSKGLLVGNDVDNVSLHHNWFVRNARRNPRVQGDNVQIINNVIISSQCTQPDGSPNAFRPITIGDNDAGKVARYDIKSNRVYGDEGIERGALIYPPQVFNDGEPDIYADGNIHDGSRTSNAQPEVDFFGNYGGANPVNFNQVTSPHVASTTTICTHDDVTTDELRDYLLGCVGNHSWARDVNESRVLALPAGTSCTNTAVQLY